MNRILFLLLLILSAIHAGLAEDTSFHRIQVPDDKGRPTYAVLVFSDTHKAVEVRPVKGTAVTIPYSEIYKISYEYTKKHRINEETIATAPAGVGALAMLTKSRSHWLEIEYNEQNILKTYVLRMDKHNYLHVLDAVKSHTGKEVEVLGNANKR